MTGAELAVIRQAKGFSQTRLAKLACIGRSAVRYWETRLQVDRGAWGMQRIAKVLLLPDNIVIARERAGWGERLEAQIMARKAAMGIVALALSEWEAQRAATARVQCGAKTRKGMPCMSKSIPGKRRCKFHGGMSTGARTQDGKARIAEAQYRRWARWRDVQKATRAQSEK